jgi:hypothetical protein
VQSNVFQTEGKNMGLDTPSPASGSQTDALLQKTVGDIQVGQLNNAPFSQDIRDLYARDQATQGKFNADLLALNEQLEANHVLPNLALIGEDGQGDLIYDNPSTKVINVISTDQKQVDSGPEQAMAVKYGFIQANAADQNSAGSDQSNPQSGAGSDQSNAQATAQDQSAQTTPQDQPAQTTPQDQTAQTTPQDQTAQTTPQDQTAQSSDQTPPAPAAAGQPEVWGQHGRQYTPTPGQNGEYSHVVEQFQGADKPGDTMYRIASDSLDMQHGNDPSYQPSGQDVTAEIQRIAAYNQGSGTIGQPPNYEIEAGETIKIPPKDWTASSAQTSDAAPAGQNASATQENASAAQDTPTPGSPSAPTDSTAQSSSSAPSDSQAQSSSSAPSDSMPPGSAQAAMNNPASNDSSAQGYTQAPADNPSPGNSTAAAYAQGPADNPAPINSTAAAYAQGPADNPPPSDAPAPVYAQTPPYYSASNDAPDPGYSQTYPYNQPAADGPPPGYTPSAYNPAADYSAPYGYASQPPYSYPAVEPNYFQPGPPQYGYANEVPYGYAQPPFYGPPREYYRPTPEIYVNPVGIVRDVARLFRR